MPSTTAGLLLVFAVTAGHARTPGAPEPPRPVLVELFTSEGCSSCPPADLLLMDLDRAQKDHGVEVVVLGEHVDYWDRGGWRDPFSSAQFTDRQSAYAARFKASSMYTPEMVVDGRVGFVGSDRGQALRAIAEAARQPKAKVTLALEPGHPGGAVRLSILVEEPARIGNVEPAEVYLAVTENGLQSRVLGGENAGRRLDHTAVVRRLIALGHTEAGTGGFTARPEVALDPGWNREHLRAVVFLQRAGCGPVLGSAGLSLAGPGSLAK